MIANHIRMVLAGDSPVESLGPCASADIAMPIYIRARAVLALPQAERRAAIDRMPPELVPILEKEIKRLWNHDRTNRKR